MKKLLGLQYLRGVAAVAVVAFHAAGRSGNRFLIGEAGVDLFFVLSGFLMVAITTDQSRPLKFMYDRVRRICPPYWIATSIIFLGALIGLFPNIRLTYWHIISSYLFIPSFSPSNGQIWPLLAPGWTLNYEIVFYGVFAVLMLFRSQACQLILLSLFFIGLVVLSDFIRPRDAILSTYTNPIILEFVLGGWIAFFWKKDREWSLVIGWPSMLIAVGLMILASSMSSDRMRALFFGVPAALCLISMLGLERRERLPRLRLPLMLGDASYSIYLWHAPAISIVLKICGVLHTSPAIVFTASIAAGLAAGLLGFRLIEAPIIKAINRISASPRAFTS